MFCTGRGSCSHREGITFSPRGGGCVLTGRGLDAEHGTRTLRFSHGSCCHVHLLLCPSSHSGVTSALNTNILNLTDLCPHAAGALLHAPKTTPSFEPHPHVSTSLHVSTSPHVSSPRKIPPLPQEGATGPTDVDFWAPRTHLGIIFDAVTFPGGGEVRN